MFPLSDFELFVNVGQVIFDTSAVTEGIKGMGATASRSAFQILSHNCGKMRVPMLDIGIETHAGSVNWCNFPRHLR